MNEIRYIVALWLLVAVSLTAWLIIPVASAYSLDESFAAQLAKECFDVGVMCGNMNSGEIFAQNSAYGTLTYNRMVDKVNPMIRQHNELMILMFSGNATALSELLVPTYDYI